MVFKTANEIWESLEKKYQNEDAGSKKFVLAKFLDCKMVYSKFVVSQTVNMRKASMTFMLNSSGLPHNL